MNLIRDIWSDVRSGQNIDVYVTIVLALLVATLGTWGIADQSIISSAVLATLALVSIGILVNRRENSEIRRTLSSLESTQNPSETLLRNDYDVSQLPNLVRHARKVLFCGINFTSHIPLLREDLEYGLQVGLEARFLMMKPHGRAIPTAAFRSRTQDPNDISSTCEKNLTRLDRLSRKATSGKLEYRVVDFLPPYTIIVIDPDLPSGKMYVRLSSFRTPNKERPTLEIAKRDDNEWFQFFVNQFELMWAASEKYEVTSNNT